MSSKAPTALVPAEADPERAWKKLAAARDRTEVARSPLVSVSAVKLYALQSLAALVVVGLMAFLIARDPANWNPATWSENATTPIAGALSLYVVGAWAWLFRRRSKLHPAERVLRDFYATLNDDGKIRQLEDFVTSPDFDDSDRRETPFGPKATIPRITNGPELDFYWNTLIRGNGRPRAGVDVVGIRMQELADDLRLAYVRLRVSRRSTLQMTLL
jgi:uncharacterized protein (TIGR03382 family)